MRHLVYVFLAMLLCCALRGQLEAAVYISDPAAGGGGNGSKSAPWPSLEACIKNGKLQKLRGGDTLYLLKGYHGTASLGGINDAMITIAGAPGHDVRLSKLTLSGAANWHIKDLRISPTFGKPYKGTIVSFNDRSTNSGKVIIEGCEIFGVDNHKGLSFKDWMSMNSGILMGRHGKGSIVRNCYIRNTRFALSLSAYDGIAEGNIIENFSADGIRMTRDGQISRYNVIKSAFATDAQGDKNHDDAIQCFLHNKGTGTMRNLTINHNIILGSAPGVEPFAAVNQGIGLFDGPLVNFHIEGNVVMVSHWHGVSVYDGQGCTITKNVTYTIHSGKLRPWVMLGTKLKKAKDNIVKDNYAMSFKLKQPGTVEENNKIVTKEIYEQALLELSKVHFEKYGQYHRVAKRHRITGAYVEELPEDKSGSDKDKQKKVAKGKKGKSAKTNKETVNINPEQIEEFNKKLQARLDTFLTEHSRKPRFVYSVLKQEVSIESKQGDTYQVNIPKLGSKMKLPLFKRLKNKDALAICEAVIDKNDEMDNALLAFYYFACKDTRNGNFHLRKAGDHKSLVESALQMPSASE